MTAQPANFRAFTDAARDSVAREIATLRREAQREREVRDAEHAARLAQLDAKIAIVSDLERKLSDRIASLRDGTPGRDGTDGQPGKDGRDVDPADVERFVTETVQRVVGAWERPKDGRDGRDGTDGQPGKDGRDVDPADVERFVTETVQRVVGAWERPKDGRDGRDGTDGQTGPQGERGEKGEPGEKGDTGQDGRDGQAGAPGEQGPEGPAGKLALVRLWEDRVHYEGDLVAHDGSTYQAARDTGRKPPHDDWICLARAGRDGQDARAPLVRGTYDETGSYLALDIVALNGASFIAKHDEPGPCPGDGWQLMSAQGKRGKEGPAGPRGSGERGLPGEPVVAMHVDDQGLLVLVNGDGSEVVCDLYPVLSKLRQ